MDWRGRLRELVLAGGAVALATSSSGCFPGCQTCNANPDPCCSAPKSQACADYNACVAADADVEACYYHLDLSVPVPADLALPRDLGARD